MVGPELTPPFRAFGAPKREPDGRVRICDANHRTVMMLEWGMEDLADELIVWLNQTYIRKRYADAA